mmetsp:Transcript_38674/g.90813  ORF Transcript_38674/g.90813 Transcript_38674/m.90813 type:complete len:282 (-) Transcript_38674:33-878(-)
MPGRLPAAPGAPLSEEALRCGSSSASCTFWLCRAFRAAIVLERGETKGAKVHSLSLACSTTAIAASRCRRDLARSISSASHGGGRADTNWRIRGERAGSGWQASMSSSARLRAISCRLVARRCCDCAAMPCSLSPAERALTLPARLLPSSTNLASASASAALRAATYPADRRGGLTRASSRRCACSRCTRTRTPSIRARRRSTSERRRSLTEACARGERRRRGETSAGSAACCPGTARGLRRPAPKALASELLLSSHVCGASRPPSLRPGDRAGEAPPAAP